MSCACPRRPDPYNTVCAYLCSLKLLVPFLESYVLRKCFEEEPLGGVGAGFSLTVFSH